MKTYDILLVDADDTIFDFSIAEDKALYAACGAMGIRVTADQAAEYKRINESLWRAFQRKEVTQEALKVLRFERFLQYLGLDYSAQEMADAFVAGLSLQTDEIDGAFDFLQEAAARVPVIVVTNGIVSVQKSRFGLSRLQQFIAGHVISGEVGFAKPDPRMITRALELGGMSAGQALMLGDEPTSDIAAANAAGVDSCWFNPSGRVNQTPYIPTYEVRALDEVLQWL